MKLVRSFVRSLVMAAGIVLLTASPLLAQSPSPSASPTSKPFLVGGWSKWMALVLTVVGVGVLGMTLLGYLVQSPGFRRTGDDSSE